MVMLLSMWHIADALAAYNPIVDIREGPARLEGARFIVAEPDARYDVRYAHLYPDESSEGGRENVFISNGSDIVEVRDVNANEVLNAVLETFDRHNRWEAGLREAAQADSLQGLIDCGHQMLLNPIMLADASGHVLAMTSAHRALDLNASWVEARETGSIPAAILGAPRFTEEGRPTRWTHKPRVFVLEDGTKTIGAVLKQEGQRVGGIAVWEHMNPIMRSHLYDMQVLCRILESTDTLGLPTSSLRAVGAILADLIDGKVIEPRLLGELNVGFPAPWSLAVIWSPTQNASGYARNLIKRFSQIETACIPFEHLDSVCVLAPAGTCQTLVGNVLGEQGLRTFSTIESLPFSDLAHIGTHFELVRYVRTAVGLGTTHAFAQDFTLAYFTSTLLDALPAARLAHPALAILTQHDAETGGDLLGTLDAYLQNDQNIVKSARALGLHRNSMAARIRKIKSLTGISLDDPDERLYLMVSLRLL